jgi:hypothetical protein
VTCGVPPGGMVKLMRVTVPLSTFETNTWDRVALTL